jgi:hypothetical protein
MALPTFLRILGVIFALWGVLAVWLGFGASEDIRKLDNTVYGKISERAYRKGNAPEADKVIAESNRDIEGKKVERIIWFSVAGVSLIGGLGLALLTPSARRKARAAGPAPASKQAAPEL